MQVAEVLAKELTPEQRKLVHHDTLLVKACPGSGKTRLLTAYVYRRIAGWAARTSGIAAISFTNVACDEIRKRLISERFLGRRVSFPHLISTLDSFCLKYLILPHVPSILGSTIRLQYVHPDHSDWLSKFKLPAELRKKGVSSVSQIEYLNGLWRARTPYGAKAIDLGDTPPDAKVNQWKAGYITQPDCNYFLEHILHSQEPLVAALSHRFRTIAVDEVQDLSGPQIDLLRALGEQGSDLFLVGDRDQSIYEWRDAKPERLKDLETIVPVQLLNDNFRSSQHICDATQALSSLPRQSRAVGTHAKNPDKPTLIPYREVANVLEAFRYECKKLRIPRPTRRILVRTHEIAEEVRGRKSFRWPKGMPRVAKNLIRAQGYLAMNEPHRAALQAQNVLVSQVFPGNSTSDLKEGKLRVSWRTWRSSLWGLLLGLPDLDRPLQEWLSLARARYTEWLADLPMDAPPRSIASSFKTPQEEGTSLVREFVSHRGEPEEICTIHSVKGDEFDAVLLIATKERHVRQWFTLEGDTLREEGRTVYVGMTRATRMLRVGIPTGAAEFASKRLPGFTLSSAV